MSSEKVTLHRGLQGVYFDRTETTFIDGRKGILEYRGYSIHDLAEKSTFEETSYLLLYGSLPTRAELSAFDSKLKAARPIPGDVVDIIRKVQDSHPMDVLRTGVSALAATDPDIGDNSAEATFRKGVRLTSQVPTIVMAHNAIRNGREIVDPDPGLSHAANFLYMLNGEKPNDDTAELLDRDFILHADHGSNASAFTARVVAGTGADLHSAVTAGVAALSGPFHGGAAENVMTMTEEIGSPENAAAYVKELLSTRRRVMGFGHRVYRAEDPRARHLRSGVRRLSHEMGEPKWYDILEAVIEAMKTVRPPRDPRERRLLRRGDVPPDRHSERPLRTDICSRPSAWLDHPGRRAISPQHPYSSAAAICRRTGARIRTDRRPLKPKRLKDA